MSAASRVAALPEVPPPRGIRRMGPAIVVHGILWGIAASVLDSLTLPADEGFVEFLRLFAWTAPGWCLVGMGIALWIRVAQDHLLRPWFFAASVAGGALVLSAVRSLVYAAVGSTGPADLFPNGTDPVASFFYQAWLIAFYGGAYLLAWTLEARVQRTRRLLTHASVARLRTQASLGEAQLTALRNHIEPALLLRAMDDIERRYAADAAAADRLLGILVNFLRLAMPGVRGRRSTVANEIEICRAYVALAAELSSPGAVWAFTCPREIPNVALPPLSLLALQIAAAARSPLAFRGRMIVAVAAGRLCVTLGGDPPPSRGWLDAQAVYRLRVGLATIHREAARLQVADEPDTARPLVTISVPLDAGKGEA